ncbi:hypothetical protein JCM19237_6845 [Photobacterium aphoticum]|uniref:Uncharacterized protein n=1 Tax=Photobacterium aphoticum TaxID=754436 RepID=A0A090R0P2_9GAMM|nr:hypothetical protein JCM19237_6845 [Photobacterium aphoticum]
MAALDHKATAEKRLIFTDADILNSSLWSPYREGDETISKYG